MRHAVLTPFFGRLRDRFCDYGEPRALADKLEYARAVPGVDGVELIFPDEVREASAIRADLDRLGLEVAAVNVNLKGERVFERGALSSPDAGVRDHAIELLCEAKRLARDLGTTRITCAPLSDGYDYAFQVDYRRVWTRMADCIARAGECLPEIALHIEHKPAEPRVRGLLDVPLKVVRLCRDVGLASVGITFNTGHAGVGGGSPAAALADVIGARVPYYIHFCDATPSWDWDLRAGTSRFWEWAEVLFYLTQDGYHGWLTADTFPVRQDAQAMFAANVSMTAALCRWIDRLDHAAVVDALARHRAGPMRDELERCLPGHA